MKLIFIYLALFFENYYFDCKTGCLKCTSFNTCLICDTNLGFYSKDNNCVYSNKENCFKITHHGECIQCKYNFYLDFATFNCIPVEVNKRVQYCSLYDRNQKCLECLANYMVQNGFCVKVKQLINNCDIYFDDGFCKECSKGYIFSSDFIDCVPIPNNLKCQEFTFISCKKCLSGFFLDKNYYFEGYQNITTLRSILMKFKFSTNTNWTVPQVCRPTNVTFCDQFSSYDTCIKCVNGYYLQNGKCVLNPLPEILNCLIYTSNNKCSECNKGFYLFNYTYCKEVSKIENCITYDGKSFESKCLECTSEYFAENGLCFQRTTLNQIQNCNTFSKYSDVCDECLENYILNFDRTQCFKKIENCKKYNIYSLRSLSLICDLCDDGYFLTVSESNSNCTLGPVANCKLYKMNNECSMCSNGFYLENGSCNSHITISECTTYSPDVRDTCLSCSKGFYAFQISTCLPVNSIPNCLEYNKEGNKCLKCDKFSYLSDDKCFLNPGYWINCEVFDGQLCLKCNENFMLNSFNSTTDCILPFSYVTQNCQTTNARKNNQTFSWGILQPNPIVCNSCVIGHIPFKPMSMEAICIKTMDLFLYSSTFSLIPNCFRYGFNSLDQLVCMECSSPFFIKNYWPLNIASVSIVCDIQTIGVPEVILLDDLYGFVNISIPIGTLPNQIDFPNCKYAARISTFNQASGGSVKNDFSCFSTVSAYAPIFSTVTPLLFKDTSYVLFGVSKNSVLDNHHSFATNKDGSSVKPLIFNFRGIIFSGSPILLSSIVNYSANFLSKCEILWLPGDKGTGSNPIVSIAIRIDPLVYQCLRCNFGLTAVSIPSNTVSLYPSCVDFPSNECSASIILGGLPSYLNAILGCHSCFYNSLLGVQNYPTIYMEYGGQGGSIDYNNWLQFMTDPVKNGFKCAPAPSKLLNSTTTSYSLNADSVDGPVSKIQGCSVFGEIAPINSISKTVIAANPLIAVCLACYHGTYPVYAQYSSINHIPTWAVISCNSIPNCELNSSVNSFNSCGKCQSFILDQGDIYFAYTDSMLTNCQLSNSKNCFILKENNDPSIPSDCEVCQSGFVLNSDGFCEQIVVPFGNVFHPFVYSYFPRFYSGFLSNSIVFQGFDSIQVRIHYLLSFSSVQYGTRSCESFLYTLAPPSSISPIVCIFSTYVLKEMFSNLTSTHFVSGCLVYSAYISETSRFYPCEICVGGLIPTEDGSKCVKELSNCLVARNLPFQQHCNLCQQGYINALGNCGSGKIPNCLSYKNGIKFFASVDFQCQTCQAGYFLSNDFKSCFLGISSNCLTYSLGSPSNCLACVPGYFLLLLPNGIKYCYKAPENRNCDNYEITNFNIPLNINRLACTKCYQNNSTIYGFSWWKSESEKVIESVCLPFQTIENCDVHDQSKLIINQNTFECISCNQDFWLSKNNNTCMQRIFKHSKCKNYSKTSDECEECSSEYFYDSVSRVCVLKPKGISNCALYLNADMCVECLPPYYAKKGKCLPTKILIPNCEKYSGNFICESCLKGYFKSSFTECVATNVPNCAVFSSESVCTECLDNYVLFGKENSSICKFMTLPNCEIVFGENVAKCKKCNNNFILDEKWNCVKIVSTISNCLEFSTPTKCKLCKHPSVLNQNQTSCISSFYQDLVDPNCSDSHLLSVPTCSKCPPGQFFLNETCFDCAENSFSKGCMACEPKNQSICFICVSGYHQDSSGKCKLNILKPIPLLTNYTKKTSQIFFCFRFMFFFFFYQLFRLS